MSATDKAKNKAETAKGAAKEVVGRVTNDKQLEGEGAVDRVIGDLKQAGEKVKDAVRRK
jgi:uncharacterized protein YjbJ (UPF0337 family)